MPNASIIPEGSSLLAGRPAGALVGVVPGEGIGPEVCAVAIELLRAVDSRLGLGIQIESAEGIGVGEDGLFLPGPDPALLEFFRKIAARGGAVLCGPGGGRFVYELRRKLDLFCKLVPVVPLPELRGGSVDLVIVRENIGGVYFADTQPLREGPRRGCELRFRYEADDARRLLRVAAELASFRRGRLAVAVKDGGLPELSDMWRAEAEAAASEAKVALEVLNVDYAAYRVVQEPQSFDVLAASNLFGDLLSDVAAVHLGSRTVSFGASYSEAGATAYQTNHGAAWDLAGKDRANPIGQTLSLAMLLRETLRLPQAAAVIERACGAVLGSGHRPADLDFLPGKVVGTREFGELLVEAVLSGTEAAVAS